MRQARTQQQWAKDIIKEIILLMNKRKYNGNFMTEGYSYTINAVIDNYSLTYMNKNGENINIFHKYSGYREGLYKNILMSEDARTELEKQKNSLDLVDNARKSLVDQINGAVKYKKDRISDNPKNSSIEDRLDIIRSFDKALYVKLKKDYDSYKKHKENRITNEEMADWLHGEHITTQSHTRRILNDILDKLGNNSIKEKDIAKEIDYAFRDCKIIIITKDESDFLDKAPRYTQEEIDKYKQNIQKSNYNYDARFEKECDALVGCSKKKYGVGSIRIQVLRENRVKIVDSQGNEQNLDECLAYLNDGCFTT